MVSDRFSRPQPASDGCRWLQTASDDFRKLRVVQMASGGFTIRRPRGVPFEVNFAGFQCSLGASPRHRSEVLRSSLRRPALRGGWCLLGMQGIVASCPVGLQPWCCSAVGGRFVREPRPSAGCGGPGGWVVGNIGRHAWCRWSRRSARVARWLADLRHADLQSLASVCPWSQVLLGRPPV